MCQTVKALVRLVGLSGVLCVCFAGTAGLGAGLSSPHVRVRLFLLGSPSGFQTTTDLASLGSEITHQSQLAPGTTVFLEVWCQTPRPRPISTVAVDLTYDTAFFDTSVAQVILAAQWDLLPFSIAVHDNVGFVDNLGGSNLAGLGAAPEWAKIGTVALDVTSTPADPVVFCSLFAGGRLTFAILREGVVSSSQVAYECLSVGCRIAADCDDVNACTDDFCDINVGCFHAAVGDQSDTDDDGVVDACDPDDDNDCVDDLDNPPDLDPLDPFACQDSDGDGCDDCANGGFGICPDPHNDGPDTDGDGICDVGDNCIDVSNADQIDTDSDGDGDACDPDDDDDCIDDVDDAERLNPLVCGDSDCDRCDDCSNGGFGVCPDPTNDGTDTDGDGLCDASGIGGGDFNGDGVVHLDDWAAFVDCMAGPAAAPNPLSPGCVRACLAAFDSDNNGTVDLKDTSAFQQMRDP